MDFIWKLLWIRFRRDYGKMRQCIFCMQWKEEKEFNREHIILEALGGKGDKDICLNVCTACNSSLGTRVDASLLNQDITKYMRYKFKIKGKNGIPNPFSGSAQGEIFAVSFATSDVMVLES